jgi:hypothetical protein
MPAGMVRFFRELAHLCENDPHEASVPAPLFEKHDLELLGPPLVER